MYVIVRVTFQTRPDIVGGCMNGVTFFTLRILNPGGPECAVAVNALIVDLLDHWFSLPATLPCNLVVEGT